MQSQRGPVYVATPAATGLDELATATFRGAADDLTRLASAIAHEIDPTAAADPTHPAVADLDETTLALARRIAQDLLTVDRVAIICGTSLGSEALLDAAARVAAAP